MRSDLCDVSTPGRRPRSYISFEAGAHQVAQPHSSEMGEGNRRTSQNKNHCVWRSPTCAVLSGLKSLKLCRHCCFCFAALLQLYRQEGRCEMACYRSDVQKHW